MPERRSMGAALDLSADKMAFIEGGPPVAAKPPIVAKTEVPRAAPAEEFQEEPKAQPARSEPTSARRSRARRHVRAPMPAGDDHLLGVASLLMPLTTRLQPVTYAALRRAGLEQRLRGQSPGTVQEIAEQAIQGWLRDYGYME